MHIWDMAASSLIAREAGCFVSDPKGGELNLLNRGILVSSSKELAEQVFPLITPIPYESD
jgi:myo-inositol-1(or 4)-monophosphatase